MVSTNDVQRLFLQALLSRRFLSAKLAQTLWAKCIRAIESANENVHIQYSNDRASWDAFVDKINHTLDGLNLELRHLHDEETGREMYALVNMKDDEIAQMATDYSPVEIAYFKAVVEQIMLAPNECYSVSSLAALREVSSLKSNMSKTQAENVLGSFVARGWLVKSVRGRYSLSTRAILELSPYLKAGYSEEIIECTICMEMLTRGYACYTPACKTRLHDHCFKNYRRTSTKCPSCSVDWAQASNTKKLIPVGEGATKDGQEEGRRHRRGSTADGSDDEGESVEEEEALQPQTQGKKNEMTKRKSSGKAARVKHSYVEEEAEEDDDDELEEEEVNDSMDFDTAPQNNARKGSQRSAKRR